MCVRAGEDEAVLVAVHGLAKPFSARSRAEEEEQERERHALAAPEGHRFEVPVRAMQLRDLAVVAHRDAVALELSHEVIGHRLPQICAAVHQGHERAAAREPDGGLAGRVAAAHDAHA
jgi:hypothetical protein